MMRKAIDDREEAGYIKDALLIMADKFAEQMVNGLTNRVHNYEDDKPIAKIKGAISLFYLICDDAFASLDEALKHGKALEEAFPGANGEDSVAKKLPEDWPWWCKPDYSQVEKEIKADPRWKAWVKKTNN